ncbi:LysR substrate-binding domain-containing protein [Rhizobium sp. SG570]|jgi:DNA-binding transcriptional LysR family regulator|uniref:LysR substrate-binding domain-containing protein n=1 Tax=Rhizobium sp. SG570 TaxID=2587113 RepID=UPI0009E0548B|nr:LysR substrate-binding domain-containing protein [Rhizobium sp. SG570]NKJ36493.1 DNA-binding transcriptional LysR family regulator [Rhizobium sp. SG570]
MSIAGLVARWNVADDVRAGRLVQIKIQGVEPEPLAVWAVYPTTRMLLPKVRAFIEALDEKLTEMLGPLSRPDE